MRRILIALFLFVTTAAAEECKRGEIVDGAVTATDPVINYAYYLPSNYTTDERWPVLYIFDPGSRGVFAAGLFRSAAEQYGWILVSSNNTRSDSGTALNVRALEATRPRRAEAIRRRYEADLCNRFLGRCHSRVGGWTDRGECDRRDRCERVAGGSEFI